MHKFDIGDKVYYFGQLYKVTFRYENYSDGYLKYNICSDKSNYTKSLYVREHEITSDIEYRENKFKKLLDGQV